jgi:hypothetical protein
MEDDANSFNATYPETRLAAANWITFLPAGGGSDLPSQLSLLRYQELPVVLQN